MAFALFKTGGVATSRRLPGTLEHPEPRRRLEERPGGGGWKTADLLSLSFPGPAHDECAGTLRRGARARLHPVCNRAPADLSALCPAAAVGPNGSRRPVAWKPGQAAYSLDRTVGAFQEQPVRHRLDAGSPNDFTPRS